MPNVVLSAGTSVPGGRANHITRRIVQCASPEHRHPCILYILPSDPVCIPGCTRCVPLGQPLLGARGSLGHVAQEPGREPPGNIHTCTDRAELLSPFVICMYGRTHCHARAECAGLKWRRPRPELRGTIAMSGRIIYTQVDSTSTRVAARA